MKRPERNELANSDRKYWLVRSFCNLAIENEQVDEQTGAPSFATLRRGKVEKIKSVIADLKSESEVARKFSTLATAKNKPYLAASTNP